MSGPNPPLGYALDTQPDFLRQTAASSKIIAAPSNGRAIAEVDADAPNTIKVREPDKFTQGVETHELAHEFQDSRHSDSPGILSSVMSYLRSAQSPAPSKSYDYGGEDGLIRAQQQRKTIADFGLEQQAEMVRDFQEKTKQAIASGNTEMLDKVNAAYLPFIRQFAALPGKGDPMTSIDTHPLPPGLPASSVTGIMEPDALLGGEARIVTPKGYLLQK